jgi:ELWxxDGT repeat protein
MLTYSWSLVIFVGGILFFAAYTTTNGFELWKSDGSVACTVMVKDIRAGLWKEKVF